uniref:Uncharacterized protein n=1 Tax=Oryza meridionalis TaxID=40149 RepID=A0A0E0CLA8_9ORYZ
MSGTTPLNPSSASTPREFSRPPPARAAADLHFASRALPSPCGVKEREISRLVVSSAPRAKTSRGCRSPSGEQSRERGGDPGPRVDPPMVLPQQNAGFMEADGSASFIRKLQLSVSDGLPHAAPVPELSTQEHELGLEWIHPWFFPSKTQD